MSQAKVDKKKQDKLNRKKIIRKRKFEDALSIGIVVVIAVAIIGWIGYSTVVKYQEHVEANKEYEYFDVATDAIQDYMQSVEN
ncbi:MAG: hypothetical protein K5773_00465 [Pseudobutyrivibrio sp.]|nr:hypothetical protein [Pseudobutyrivibrio sp.]